jgi:hypothetical protein
MKNNKIFLNVAVVSVAVEFGGKAVQFCGMQTIFETESNFLIIPIISIF